MSATSRFSKSPCVSPFRSLSRICGGNRAGLFVRRTATPGQTHNLQLRPEEQDLKSDSGLASLYADDPVVYLKFLKS